MTAPFPSRRAFTLIELLVVIAIIAVLITLLFPAADAAFESARRTQAKNDATQIATAVNMYATEYGRMPTESSDDVTLADSSQASLMDVLSPDSNNPPSLNPRGITFLEVPRAKSGKNGRVNNSGPFFDSWSKAYSVVLDGNFDNKVSGPDGDIQKTVIVWSNGNPKKTKNGQPNYVKSWD